MAHAALRPDPLRARRQRELAEQRRRQLLHRRTGREVDDATRPGVQADHRPGLRARGEDRLPPVREDRLHPDAVRLLRQRDGDEAARRVATDLLGAQVGVAEERDAERHDARRMARVPLVEEPVVPRLRDREPELGIGATREHGSAEPGDLAREVDRRPHAVDVHVTDTRVDVVATEPHVLEAGRLHPPVLLGPADDRVQPDLEVDLAVELPDLVALDRLDHLRRQVLEPGREATEEHVRRFHEVVVDGDQRVADGARLGVGQQPVHLALPPVQLPLLAHGCQARPRPRPL